ncbi:MAG: hypothetical protein ACLFMO_03665 [Eubacteriales bacterium]
MKSVAKGLLMILILSIIIEPLVEVANIIKEQIVLGTAVSNACRAARNRSLNYEKHRDIQAIIDEDTFREYFSEAFEDAMKVTRTASEENSITFTSKDGRHIIVELDITYLKDTTDKEFSKVEMTVTSQYKFKTKYLQLVEKMNGETFELTSDRMLLIRIRN